MKPPKDHGTDYEELWRAAQRLADEIDDPNGAPLEQRRALLPEFQALLNAMGRIEAGLVPQCWLVVDAIRAVGKIRDTKYPKSEALEATALILEGQTAKMPGKRKRAGEAFGRAIKPMLLEVARADRPKLAREVGMFFALVADGHPVTCGDIEGSGA